MDVPDIRSLTGVRATDPTTELYRLAIPYQTTTYKQRPPEAFKNATFSDT